MCSQCCLPKFVLRSQTQKIPYLTLTFLILYGAQFVKSNLRRTDISTPLGSVLSHSLPATHTSSTVIIYYITKFVTSSRFSTEYYICHNQSQKKEKTQNTHLPCKTLAPLNIEVTGLLRSRTLWAESLRKIIKK